jgi:hypothetical protein
MDHEVEDDADVGAAVGVGGEAVGFDEAGLSGDGFEVMEDGVEAFDVADLEDEMAFAGDPDQFRGLVGVVGHRFFDEHMAILEEEGAGEFEVGGGGGDDAEGVAGGDGIVGGGEGADAVAIGDAARGVGGEVVDAGEFDEAGGGEFGIDAGMFATEGSGTEDGDAERRAGGGRRGG